MPTHSNTLAGEIPWTEEPGGLQSTGSQSLLSTQVLQQSRSGLISPTPNSCQKNPRHYKLEAMHTLVLTILFTNFQEAEGTKEHGMCQGHDCQDLDFATAPFKRCGEDLVCKITSDPLDQHF